MLGRSVLILVCCLSVGSLGKAASITAVAPLAGDTVTEIFAISADGSVVAGRSWQGIGYSRAIRWTLDGGTEALPDTPQGAVAYGVSGDGNYVVGHTGDDHSFRWSETGGIEIIPGAFANAASYNGSVVVGSTIGPDRRAFRWSEVEGFLEIDGAQATGVSADGNIVVGQAVDGFFRWTPDTGRVTFGPGIARAVSEDGTTIVGGGPGGAFAWTETAGIVPVGGVNANAVSADGSVKVGHGRDLIGVQHASIDHPLLGARDLFGIFKCQGAAVAGWTLSDATGISYDGMTIAGYGIDPDGNRRGWVGTFDAIAHPGDANRDGRVDLDDLNLVRNYFGLQGAPVPGDTNYDCGVTLDDLNAVRNNFGWVAAQAVPEPSSIASLGLGVLCVTIISGARQMRCRGR